MIVSIEWLKDFVDITVAPGELADLLTNAGLESLVLPGGNSIDIEIMPNRPDCMSHRGVAREISVLTGQELRTPHIALNESSERATDLVTVEIPNPDECPRYVCRVVRDVNVGPSPKWMVERLETTRIRSINNVVDISNYVLMELGHPLHIFDLQKIRGAKIVVRMAKAGETLTTLDGQLRHLTRNHLLICDAEGPVALAGIVGGENSEVSEETTDLLIESAYFDPVIIRKGAKGLGIATEASKRFERGTDYQGLLIALDRTAHLLAEMAGGKTLNGIVDEYPKRIDRRKIELKPEEASTFVGARFTGEFIETTLRGLEISFSKTKNGYVCVAPTFRPDLERPIDLIEELARIHGYGKIESDFTYAGLLGDQIVDPLEDIIELKRFFSGLGFHEAFTNSLLNEKESGDFSLHQAVLLQNPLSIEMSTMRTSLFPGLLNAIAYNLRRDETDLALFEYGNTFKVKTDSRTGCEEREEFSGVICGYRSPKQWKGGPSGSDFYTVKGCMEALAKFLNLGQLEFKPLPEDSMFFSGQAMVSGGEILSTFGHFDATLVESYDIDVPVFGFFLDLDMLRTVMKRNVPYSKISQYPGISRDLSFLVKRSTSVADIEAIMRKNGTDLLKDVSLYDLYESDRIEEGHKSVTINLFFQDKERTLTDDEVDKIIAIIISTISRQLHAKLR